MIPEQLVMAGAMFGSIITAVSIYAIQGSGVKRERERIIKLLEKIDSTTYGDVEFGELIALIKGENNE